MKHFTLTALCTTTLLTSCVSFNTKHQEQFHRQNWQGRQKQLLNLKSWQVAGALSFKDPKQSVIASYTWQEQPKHYTLQITSALNVGGIKIIGQPGLVTLIEGKRKAYAPSASDLMQQQLGWQLPVKNLRFWIRGLPAPGKARTQFDEYNHLVTLEQSGWRIRLSKYVTFKHRDLPQELDFNKGPVAVKLIVRWGK